MVGHSPVFQILLQIEVRMSYMAFPPAWTNSAGMLSFTADFLIFSVLTAASISSSLTAASTSYLCAVTEAQKHVFSSPEPKAHW